MAKSPGFKSYTSFPMAKGKTFFKFPRMGTSNFMYGIEEPMPKKKTKKNSRKK